MLERIRQSRRLHAVVVTAFALLLLVAMLSGVRVRAATAPATHETLTQSMLHSLCLPQDAPAAAASQQQAYEEWLLSAFDTPPATHAHDEHAGPHCVLCLALMLPPALRLQAAPYPVPHYRAPWLWPVLFPAAQPVRAPLPPRGPPASFRVL